MRTEKAMPVGEAPSPCRHHWIIESPQGPVSLGVCHHCGERREFPNYINIPYGYWESAVTSAEVIPKNLQEGQEHDESGAHP